VDSSWGLTLIVIVVLLVVVISAAFIVSRRPGKRTAKPQQPRRARRDDSGERPVHLDPDPERMAGGRARFTPPFGERRG
jgi:hypothetical protein